MITRSVDDAKALHEFYAPMSTASSCSSRRTLDAETALDLTGETFALALDRRRQFRGASAQEEQGWLFAIARDLLMAFWRRGEVERAALALRSLGIPVTAALLAAVSAGAVRLADDDGDEGKSIAPERKGGRRRARAGAGSVGHRQERDGGASTAIR